ncbi:hypothetical protein GOODEAATRI_003270, partial [Goodea atripinnis]
VVEINGLELEMHTLLSDQMETLLAQRRRRIKEEADRLQQLSCEWSPCLPITQRSRLGAQHRELILGADIQSRSQAVFADVQDDFYDIKKILSRFEEWRRSYSESYHNAYISLCLPKLLNPIIRHQLLVWNPLKVSGYVKNA